MNYLPRQTVKRVTPLGIREIMGISTSTHTYTVGGLLSHNSLFAFGVIDGELRVRSKRQQMIVDAPEKLFDRAVEVARNLQSLLLPDVTYYGEYLQKPKHNVLKYERAPTSNIILFDISPQPYGFLPYNEKAAEATRLGLEVVPRLFEGSVTELAQLVAFLDLDSVLGGTKIEGFVIKNYLRFGQDKKTLMGKHVSERFKEVHRTEWKAANPGKLDIVQGLIMALKTDARWQKAIQHLQEDGVLEHSPRDIGKLMVEVPADVEKECADLIKEKLFAWAWPRIKRGVVAGLPEYYKAALLKRQFEPDVQP